MTPEQLREKAMSDPTILRAMADQLQGRPMVADDVEWLLRAHAAALEEIERLKEAVELLYDKWENGEDCHEISGDEMGVFLGKAFQLSKEEEDAILSAIGSDK